MSARPVCFVIIAGLPEVVITNSPTADTRNTATVLRVDARGALVKTAGGPVFAAMRGNLFTDDTWATRPLAAGDVVVLEGEGRDITIADSLPRSTQFTRRAAGDDPRARVIAANIQMVAVMASVGKPAFSSLFVDRVLAGAAAGDIRGVVILNKIDELPPAAFQPIAETYRNAGAAVFPISVKTGDGLDVLVEALKDKTTVLSGLSGVGKTSLINILVPGAGRAVGHLSWKWNQGKHTTTAAELLYLPSGGAIIDTPGMRNFVPWGVHRGSLRYCFPDLNILLGNCKYNDCQHTGEPGCGIEAAVASGRISRTRVVSYLAIQAELEPPPENWSEGARPDNINDRLRRNDGQTS